MFRRRITANYIGLHVQGRTYRTELKHFQMQRHIHWLAGRQAEMLASAAGWLAYR